MDYRRFGLASTAVFILAILAPAVCADWTMSRYDPASTGFMPDEITTPLVHSWSYTIQQKGKNPCAPIVAGNTVYFSAGDHIEALDAESGSLKWQYPADQPLTGAVKASPLISGNTLYFGATDGSMYAINIADGTLNWVYTAGGSIRSSPVLSNGVLYFGSDDNSLHAVDAEHGESIWRGPFATKDDIATPPAVSGDSVVFTSADGMLYSANVSTGGQRWQYRLPQVASRSAPVISSGTSPLVFIATGNNLSAIVLKTGMPRPPTPFKSEIAAGPSVAEEETYTEGVATIGTSVYVISKSKKLYALTPAGKPKWETAPDLPYTSSVAPTIAGGTVIVGTDRGSVCAYSTATGKLKWQYDILPQQTSAAFYTAVCAPITVSGKRVFVVTDDGTLHCFDADMPDQTPPEVFSLAPDRGMSLSGSPPIYVSATLFDTGSGIDPASIELALDDTVVEGTYDNPTSTVSYQTSEKSTPKILPDGRHQLSVKVKDWAGNASAVTWSFIVDNKLRPPTPVKSSTPDSSKTRNWRTTPGTTGGTTPPAYNPPSTGGGAGGAMPPPPPPPAPGGMGPSAPM